MFLEHLIRYPGLRVFLKHEHASLLCPITLSTPGVCPQSLYADTQDAEGQNKSMREILNHLGREISEVDISHLHMMARGQVPDLMTDIVPQTMAELVAHPLPFPPVIHNRSSANVWCSRISTTGPKTALSSHEIWVVFTSHPM